ncbi:hypothetical protein [Streptomyces albireticuli]|uniref:hypothetical protein n=1 Tax=Streptomyces albireticuli TaxID=1940 RepID=UPI0036C50AC6
MATVSAGQLDDLDESIRHLRRQHLYTAPALMLQALFNQLDEFESLSAERQPGAVQVRLSEMTALLATLMADALMKLGRLDRSRAWYDTAQNATDDSGILELRARVRAQRPMLPYYYGPLADAVRLTRDAGAWPEEAKADPPPPRHSPPRHSPPRPKPGPSPARATPQPPKQPSAAHATPPSSATQAPTTTPSPSPPAACCSTSAAPTPPWDTPSRPAAYRTKHCPSTPPGPGSTPALLRLEAAICLANDRSPAEACQLATATYLQVPAPSTAP